MIGRETRVLLRHYLEEGGSKSEVARWLGVSRGTVHRWIASGQLDRELDDEAVRYGPRRPVPSKLDPYKGIIEARPAAYPKLSAVRLFREVRAAGYAGGYDQVKRYVREVRPREPEEPVRRFETPPGHQGQVDFADFRLPWGRRHALVVVLGYSRLMWMRVRRRHRHRRERPQGLLRHPGRTHRLPRGGPGRREPQPAPQDPLPPGAVDR